MLLKDRAPKDRYKIVAYFLLMENGYVLVSSLVYLVRSENLLFVFPWSVPLCPPIFTLSHCLPLHDSTVCLGTHLFFLISTPWSVVLFAFLPSSPYLCNSCCPSLLLLPKTHLLRLRIPCCSVMSSSIEVHWYLLLKFAMSVFHFPSGKEC